VEHELEEIIERYSEKLLRYATTILYNHQDAEDVVQDVFISAFQNGKFAEGANTPAWLYKVTYNKSINKLNRRKFLIFSSIPENTVEVYTQSGLSDEMLEALGQLKPKERALIYARIIEGYDYAELSFQMGTSQAALRKRYERAKNKLSGYLTRPKKGKVYEKSRV
jgi:RNA polymerase sigma-70 factor (ECF subfamily)